jgi:hypothetical protein
MAAVAAFDLHTTRAITSARAVLYNKLNLGEIRLLSLLPGRYKDDIECRLMHSKLVEHASFEALSYTWGDSKSYTPTIILDGIRFPVTPNLWEALRRLRSEVVGRVLWIDALCINQNDNNEKGVQIQVMREIYRSASQVLIWLGEASTDSSLAINFIKDIPNIDLDKGRDEAWSAVRKLFQRAWWTRSWILQEVAMASSNPLVFCGSMQLPWSEFQDVYDHIIRSVSRRAISTIPPTFGSLCTTKKHRGASESEITTLLLNTYQFQATDPRDKVYSLLGLATEQDRTALKPDYNKSIEQVFIDTATYILSADSVHINILAFNTNSRSPNLPSWVSDWSLSTRRWPLWMPGAYNACGGSRPVVNFNEKTGVLGVTGVIVDEITDCDEKSRTDMEQKSSIDQTKSEILDNIEYLLERVIKENVSLKLDELRPSRSDALWRTVITDRSLYGTAYLRSQKCPAPVSYGNKYEVYRRRASIPGNFMPELPFNQRWQAFTAPLVNSLQFGDQRFFITQSGRIGLGPFQLRRGDLVVIMFGADMPFILRDKGSCYTHLGCAYIHGIMHGECFSSRSTISGRSFDLM